MNKQDADKVNKAMQTLYEVCEKAQKTRNGCKNCPANGEGKLCHSGEISCCAPYKWWGFKGLGRSVGNE